MFNLLSPNLDLLKGYKEKREQKPPGITHYKNSDRELWFVNAVHQHTGGINEDPTLRSVTIAITENEPDFVITEGHNTNMSQGDKERLLAENRKLIEAKGDIPESGYAAFLADQRHATWVGGEPSGSEFLQEMQKHGYSLDDMLAIHVLQQVAYHKLDIKNEEDLDNKFAEIMKGIKNRVDPNHEVDTSNFTFDSFKEWYSHQSLPDRGDFLAVSPDYFVPNTEGNIIQRWMADSGEERDRNIPRLLYEQFKTNRKGVIVYGADHLNSLSPVLENMFGSPGEYTRVVKGNSLSEETV
jgi:hypothetical protein